ncbi:MAG: hypothetical protein ACLTSD_10030 [Eubacterium sp.]
MKRRMIAKLLAGVMLYQWRFRPQLGQRQQRSRFYQKDQFG